MTELQDLDDLLDRIEMPPMDIGADVTRGRTALRRRHRLQVSLTALSVSAVAVGLTGGAAVHGRAGSTGDGEAPYGGRSTAAATPHPGAGHRPGKSLTRVPERSLKVHAPSPGALLTDSATLRRYRDVLAEHLDPTGDQLRLAQNEQGGSGSFGSKLDWRDGGMLEVVVGPTWGAAGGFYLLESAGMSPTTFHGQPARVSTTGSDLVVSVRHDDGTVVTLIASTAFGNNGTSTPSLGLTHDQLLAAAADPRLTLPASLR